MSSLTTVKLAENKDLVNFNVFHIARKMQKPPISYRKEFVQYARTGCASDLFTYIVSVSVFLFVFFSLSQEEYQDN